MSLLDKVRSFGSTVVNKTAELEKAVEKTVEKTGHAAVDLAKDTFEAAKSAPSALGSLAPSKAQVQHAWDDLHVATERFGGALSTAGSTLEAGSKKLRLFVPFAQEGVALGSAVKGLGGAIQAAPDRATQLLGEAQALEQKGESFLQRAEAAVGKGLKAAEQGLATVRSGVDGVKDAVTGFVGEVAKAVDYRHNIDALGPDDSYTLALGGDVSVEGVKAYGKGEIEVEKNEQGKYVVSVDGELGAGLYAEVGGKLGAQVGAEGCISVGAGGKMEMTFDSAQDAKKATEILLKQAASTAVTVQGNQMLPGAGMLAGRALAPSAEEMKFLADHTSAVELSGNVAADVSGCLGLKDVAGLFGGAEVKDEVAVRIELRDESNLPKTPPELVLTQTVTGKADLGAGLKLSGKGESDAGGSAAFAGGSGEAKVEVEQRFKLPDVKGGDLLSNPLATVQNAASSMVRSEEDKVTLGLDVSGQVAGNGGGVELEASYTGNFNELRSAVVDRLVHGDVGGALESLDQKDSLEMSVKPYTTLGVSCSPGISVMGFGVGMEFEAVRRDVKNTTEFQGSPSDAAAQFAQAMRPYLDAARTARAGLAG